MMSSCDWIFLKTIVLHIEWRHGMEILFAWQVLCVGDSPVTSHRWFPSQRVCYVELGACFNVTPNKILNKGVCRWFETPGGSRDASIMCVCVDICGNHVDCMLKSGRVTQYPRYGYHTIMMIIRLTLMPVRVCSYSWGTSCWPFFIGSMNNSRPRAQWPHRARSVSPRPGPQASHQPSEWCIQFEQMHTG